MKLPTSLLTLVATLSALTNIHSAEVDPTFAAQIDGPVHAIALDAQGNIFAGGQFAQVNGSPRNNLVRLTTIGATENNFAIATDGTVSALAIDAQNSLFVGGSFNSPARNLARLNSDGELSPLSIGTGTSGRVDCLALGADGSVAFGGPFQNLNASTAIYAGKLNSAGTIDQTFNSGLLATMSLEAGTDAIALQPDGKVIAGGNFNTSSGFTTLVRLNADGSLDETFSRNHGPILYVKNISLLANSQIIVAGLANSSREGFVRRLNADGSVDTSFQAPAFSGCVEAFAADGDGGYFVGGSFAGGLAHLFANGTLDPSWNISTDGAVLALATQGNDTVLVGGTFRAIGNVSQSNIARITYAPKSHATATNAGGRFAARLQGETGQTYTVESSEDLNSWAFFSTKTASASGIEITDANAGGRKHRFFRARLIN